MSKKRRRVHRELSRSVTTRSRPVDEAQSQLRDRMLREQEQHPEQLGPAMRHVFTAGSPDLMQQAFELVPSAASADSDALNAILAAFSAPCYAFRKHAVRLAGEWQMCELCPEVLDLLDDREELVRVEAVEALGKLACPEAQYHLRRLFSADSSYLVRGYAARAYADLVGSAAIPELAARLEAEASPWSRCSILMDLYHLGERAYLPALLKRLRSRNGRIRWMLAHSLPTLVHADDRSRVLAALRRSIGREPYPALREQFQKAADTIAADLLSAAEDGRSDS